MSASDELLQSWTSLTVFVWNSLNLNCSSYSSCFLSFCSCSRSKRDRGSYSSSGASGQSGRRQIPWNTGRCYFDLWLNLSAWVYGSLPSGSSGFLTFSHSSCRFFLFSSSSVSDTNFLLRSMLVAPPPAITNFTKDTNTVVHRLNLTWTCIDEEGEKVISVKTAVNSFSLGSWAGLLGLIDFFSPGGD